MELETISKADEVSRRSTPSEVARVLTLAKVLLEYEKKELKLLCKQHDPDNAKALYKRISKLVSGTPGYTARAGEKELVASWFDTPVEADQVFADVGPEFVKWLLAVSLTRKKSGIPKGSTPPK